MEDKDRTVIVNPGSTELKKRTEEYIARIDSNMLRKCTCLPEVLECNEETGKHFINGYKQAINDLNDLLNYYIENGKAEFLTPWLLQEYMTFRDEEVSDAFEHIRNKFDINNHF